MNPHEEQILVEFTHSSHCEFLFGEFHIPRKCPQHFITQSRLLDSGKGQVRDNFVKPEIDTVTRNRQLDTIPSQNRMLPGACPRGPAWEAREEKAEMEQATESAPSPMVACFHPRPGDLKSGQ